MPTSFITVSKVWVEAEDVKDSPQHRRGDGIVWNFDQVLPDAGVLRRKETHQGAQVKLVVFHLHSLDQQLRRWSCDSWRQLSKLLLVRVPVVRDVLHSLSNHVAHTLGELPVVWRGKMAQPILHMEIKQN